MHQSNILWKKKLHINFLHFLFLLVKDPCPPVWKGENGEVMWRGHGAQENRPDIPVGAIAHHRAQVPGSHRVCGTHWCVCVCGTHWSEVVHQGVQHPHCVVRGSLSSHSRAPRSKLELPPVINSASAPSFFLSLLLLHPFPKLCYIGL